MWALALSPIADPEARQSTLAAAPAHWQPTIRHTLAWRLGMAALRATLRRTDPPVGDHRRREQERVEKAVYRLNIEHQGAPSRPLQTRVGPWR